MEQVPTDGSNGQGRRRTRLGLGTALLTAALASLVPAAPASAKEKEPAAPTSTTVAATTSAASPEGTTTAGSDSAALGSMASVVDQIGARSLWRSGITGAGVTVAVIDTGVAPVPALSGPDKVVAMVDLSNEASVPEAEFLDTYGHGTHMTGIIAGRDPGADPASAGSGDFLGVAPDAQVVSIKAAGNTGAVDVSQIIAGIDWAIAHKDELGIRVLNLSYGTDSTQAYEIDPLAFAVEEAWRAGIVVVVAAGNDGRGSGRLANPAIDPFVIAVAAAEPKDDGKWKVPSWATSGDGVRNPDLTAPGVSIQSLRAPGSRIDVEHPEGYVSETLFKGSGSSQSAAVVSGAAALLLSARPELTPDEVKALLLATADPFQNNEARFQGRGLLDIDDAVASKVPAGAAQQWKPSDGSGSLEAARGSSHMVIDGVELAGERTVLGTEWDGRTWRDERWSDGTWDGRTWRAASWRGVTWESAQWTGRTWRGEDWTGVQWTSAAWTGGSWSAAQWSAATWSGRTWRDAVWDGRTWRDADWDGRTWRDSSWDGRTWRDASWTGRTWRGGSWT